MKKNLLKGMGREVWQSTWIFKASALWADPFYKSICPYVCLFTFEVLFKTYFGPHFLKSDVQQF